MPGGVEPAVIILACGLALIMALAAESEAGASPRAALLLPGSKRYGRKCHSGTGAQSYRRATPPVAVPDPPPAPAARPGSRLYPGWSASACRAPGKIRNGRAEIAETTGGPVLIPGLLGTARDELVETCVRSCGQEDRGAAVASEARHEALIDALAEQVIAPKVCHIPVQRRHKHRTFGFQEGEKAMDQRHEPLAAQRLQPANFIAEGVQDGIGGVFGLARSIPATDEPVFSNVRPIRLRKAYSLVISHAIRRVSNSGRLDSRAGGHAPGESRNRPARPYPAA